MRLEEFDFRLDPKTKLTMKLAAHEGLKNGRRYLFSVFIDPIPFKLAYNEDMNNVLDEFGFRPYQTTDFW